MLPNPYRQHIFLKDLFVQQQHIISQIATNSRKRQRKIFKNFWKQFYIFLAQTFKVLLTVMIHHPVLLVYNRGVSQKTSILISFGTASALHFRLVSRSTCGALLQQLPFHTTYLLTSLLAGQPATQHGVFLATMNDNTILLLLIAVFMHAHSIHCIGGLLLYFQNMQILCKYVDSVTSFNNYSL